MDLLDLELDLNVQSSRESSQGPVTRRSQSSKAAKTNTPSYVAQSSPNTQNLKSTPKSSTSVAKKTPKSASNPTPKPKILPIDIVKQEDQELSSNSPSREGSADRDSRSLSLESKRSRNKAKKRFSPSPEAPHFKKRRTHALAPRGPRKPYSKKDFDNDLSETIGHLDIVLSERGSVEYKFPDIRMSEEPYETRIETDDSVSTKYSDATIDKARMSTTETVDSSPTPNTTKNSKRRQSAITESSEMANADAADGTEAATSSKRNSAARRSSRKSDALSLKEPKLEEPESEESVPVTSSAKRAQKRKSFAASSSDVGPSPSSAGTSETAERNTAGPSALSIRQRILEKKTSKKFELVKAPLEPKLEPMEESTAAPVLPRDSAGSLQPVVPEPQQAPATPSSSSASKRGNTPTASSSGTRISGRVSKPNRLYVDKTFNTEVLGRTRVTEQNLVNEAARETTPPLEELPARRASASASSAFKKKTPAVPKEVAPKPPQIVNGVLRGYIPSRKVPLEDLIINGEVVEKLNEEVNATIDKILLKVCADGVVHHEDIDPSIARTKRKAKIDVAKKAKIEARKLQIQMRTSHTTSSEELGKRRRTAPKTDDYFYTPTHKHKHRQLREERDATPIEQELLPETPFLSNSEKKQQRARESISHQFDAEMDAQIKEAKKFSISFNQFMKPKIDAAAKRSKVQLMNPKRKSIVPDDFYYHELLTDIPSPSNSNAENEEVQGVDTDVIDVEVSEEDQNLLSECPIGARTEALDIAEQIVVLLPRPTRMDGSAIPIDEIQIRVIEQTESRKTVLFEAIEIILEQLSYEAAPPAHEADQESYVWYNVTSGHAQELKSLFTLSNAAREDAVTWTHQFMVENLPVHVLASYLNVLRYARRLNVNPFGFIVNSTDGIDPEWTQATSLIKGFVYKRAVEPGIDAVTNTVPFHRMPNTVFLLVSPTMTFGGPTNSSSSSSSSSNSSGSRARQPNRLLKWLQGIGNHASETIGFNEEVESGTSMAEFLTDTVVQTVCRKVKEKLRERPRCKIVLVGYGFTTYVVHRVANMVGGISAIISIGFPVMTKFGRRGTCEDEILLTYCPTLFICGAEGTKYCGRAMAQLRDNMIAATGLLVVGHANDSLIVSRSFLVRVGISQAIVHRLILEKILDFLSLDSIRLAEPKNLIPPTLNNIYDLDSTLLKSDKALSGLAFQPSPSTSAMASPIGSSGRRATVAGGDEQQTTKKKRQDLSHHPAHPSFQPPSALLPSPRGAAVEEPERYRALKHLVNSTISTGDDMPRRASMGSSPRVIERGDFRDRAPRIQPPQPPPPVPRGPVDPASISLI